MAQGSIRKHERESGVRYEVVVDLGFDSETGKRRQRSKSFKTKKEAQAALTQWLSDIDRGVVVDRSRQTVAQMMAYWLETYARPTVRPTTYQCYEQTIRTHIVPALGTVPVQKLTPTHLETFYAEERAAGCGERTLEVCHLRLSQALDQALRQGLVARNVTRVVTAPRSHPEEMKTWTAVEAQQFLEVASQSVYGPIWLVSLFTGMRRGELLGLRWQDVDWERSVLSVRQGVSLLNGTPEEGGLKSKSARREVPIEPEVVAALREHRAKQNERRLALGATWQDHDLILASAVGTPINPNNLYRDYNRLVALAGVDRIRIHDQRHTHVTLALQAGANLKAVSKRVGHARASTTLDLYAHVTPEMHTEVSDKVGAALRRPKRGTAE